MSKNSEKYCLRILATGGPSMKNKLFKFSLKDPQLFKLHSNLYTNVSIHSLVKCNSQSGDLYVAASINMSQVKSHFPFYKSGMVLN
jgi:hypothetical protein